MLSEVRRRKAKALWAARAIACCALMVSPAVAQSQYPTTDAAPPPAESWIVSQPNEADGDIEFDLAGPMPAESEDEKMWEQQVRGPSANCPGGCPAFWYGQAEGLYMMREAPDREQIAVNLRLDDFDYQPGVRATIGRQSDCLDAWEVTYTGMREWSQSQSIMGAGLNSLFGPATFTFDNATAQSMSYQSQFHSLEVNHRQWGWDILSTTIGPRYIRLDEEFRLSSTSGFGSGFYNIDTETDLIGISVGGDMYYPLSRRLSIGGKTKFGLFWSHTEGATAFSDGPGGSITTVDDKDDVAFDIEIGVFATYRATPRLTFKVGYEVWYLWGVALASEQIDYSLTSFGSSLEEEGDMLISGATAGLEFQW